MRNTLTFNSQDLMAFGCYISGEGTYNAPARSVTQETVPGRNGNLIIDNGRFENIEVVYPAYITDDFTENMRKVRDYLLSIKGYGRLEDSYHPNTYRMASFTGGIDVSTSGRNNTEGQFDLSFNCKPQRFLKSGETVQTFTESGEIINPTLYDAKPLIRIYGAGTLGIGTVNVTFDGSTSYVDLDCELMDAYYGGTNKNASITLSPNEYPVLHAGTNGITLTGITSVEITPRWWHL